MVLDHSYPPDLRVENEARTLFEAGYDVTVLAIGPDTRPKDEIISGVRVVRDHLPAQIRNKMRGFAGTFPFLDAYLWWRLRSLNALSAVDAIHAHDLYLFGACIRVGEKLGVPVVGDMHENWVEALRHYKWSTTIPGKWVVNLKKWQRLENEWSQSVDHLIVVIEEMEQRLLDAGVPGDRMSVVPNTIHLDDFASWPLEEVPELNFSGHDQPDQPNARHQLTARDEPHPLRIVYTGGMDGHRGIEDVINAMPELIRALPGVQLILVGDGASKAELEDLSESLSVSGHVLFTGWQKQARVKSFMAAADVGLIPHKKTVHTDHTIPHKLFHYMHMRLPCVVSNCLPLERIVSDVKCGKVYRSGSSSELARVLIEMLENEDQRTEMGEAGFNAVATRFNWNTTAAPLLRCYQKLLGNP